MRRSIWLVLLAVVAFAQEVEEIVEEEGEKLINDFEPTDQFNDPLLAIRTKWKLEPVISLDNAPAGLLHELISGVPAANFAVLFVSQSPASLPIAREFANVAQQYWHDLEAKKAVSTSVLYFLQANASHSFKLFREYNVLRAPSLVFVQRGKKMLEEKTFALEYNNNAAHMSIAEWIATQASVQPFFSRSSSVGLGDEAEKSIFSVENVEKYSRLILLAQVVYLFAGNAKKLQSKYTCFAFSLCAYAFSVSGLIFSFLRGMPPIGASPQHGIMFFYPSERNQFILEGLMAGMFHIAVSTCLVSAAFYQSGVEVYETVETDINRSAEEKLVWAERRIRTGTVREVRQFEALLTAAKILLSASSLLFVGIVLMFQRKAPWYRPIF